MHMQHVDYTASVNSSTVLPPTPQYQIQFYARFAKENLGSISLSHDLCHETSILQRRISAGTTGGDTTCIHVSNKTSMDLLY